jgi:hypothetical protein
MRAAVRNPGRRSALVRCPRTIAGSKGDSNRNTRFTPANVWGRGWAVTAVFVSTFSLPVGRGWAATAALASRLRVRGLSSRRRPGPQKPSSCAPAVECTTVGAHVDGLRDPVVAMATEAAHDSPACAAAVRRGAWTGSRWRARRVGWLAVACAARGLARGGVRGVWGWLAVACAAYGAGSRWRARRMGLDRGGVRGVWGWLAAACRIERLPSGRRIDGGCCLGGAWTCKPSTLDDRDHRCGKLARTSGCWRTWSDTADPMSNYGQRSNQVSEREWDRPARNEAPGSREVGGSMGGHRSAEVAGLRRSRVCGGAALWTIAVRAVAGLQRAGSAGGHGVAEAAGL